METLLGLERGSDFTVTTHIGNFNQTVGIIEIDEPIDIILVIGVAVGTVMLILSIAGLLISISLCKIRFRSKAKQTFPGHPPNHHEMRLVETTDYGNEQTKGLASS